MSHAPSSASWISTLPVRCRELFLAAGTVEDHEPGARVIEQGRLETHMYLIEQGVVQVLLPGNASLQIGGGELVGEMAFFHNDARRSDVVCVEACRLRRIERQTLMNAYASSPEDLHVLLDAIAALRQRRLAAATSLQGTALDYVSQLAQESLRHRAVQHRYLTSLGEGSFPDTRWALRDFARHYYAYSCHFPRYLTTVISRLEDASHRRGLLQNLTEESGIYEEEELAELAELGVEREWIVGIPHPVLFKRFSDAMGVRRGDSAESDAVVCWREMFLQVLSHGTPAEAVGALGLGTENIVRTIYGPFVTAIERLDELEPRDTVFFPLHTAVDDHHQATLQAIAADYATTVEGRDGLRRGMLKALQLRAGFWDWLYERAADPTRAEQVL
jgi:CRP-like cAMP-binding protein